MKTRPGPKGLQDLRKRGGASGLDQRDETRTADDLAVQVLVAFLVGERAMELAASGQMEDMAYRTRLIEACGQIIAQAPLQTDADDPMKIKEAAYRRLQDLAVWVRAEPAPSSETN